MYDGLRNFFVECVLADHDAYREARDIIAVATFVRTLLA